MDYVEALLNDDYMVALLIAIEKKNQKRKHSFSRYMMMNRIIVIFLVVQSVVGLLVAFYKTLLQPDKIYSASVLLENVDMVLMVDTSSHFRSDMTDQKHAVEVFSSQLITGMQEYKGNLEASTREKIEDLQRNDKSGFFSRLIGWLFPSAESENSVTVRGGKLRVATGIFNYEGANIVQNFTAKQDVQLQAMSSVDAKHYASGSEWMPALQACGKIAATTAVSNSRGIKKRNYCVIVGDNQALCQVRKSTAVQDLRDQNPAFADWLDDTDTELEFPSEVMDCAEYTKSAEFGDMKLILMLMAKNKDLKQARLKEEAFRDFVFAALGCQLVATQVVETDAGTGIKRGDINWGPEQGPGCNRFIMETGYDELRGAAGTILAELQPQTEPNTTPNADKDYRYLAFLLLPLNLVLYVLWSQIVRALSGAKDKMSQAMGKKKKMIKVTKTVVEKEMSSSNVRPFAAQMTEVELAEMASIRPVVQWKAPTTMRARFKGGFIRTFGKMMKSGERKEHIDGNGTAFDPFSNWTFQAEGAPASGLHTGVKLRILNAKGNVLCSDPQGNLTFRAAAEAEGQEGDFVMTALQGAEGEVKAVLLGDAVQIRSLSSGKYIRVQKEGDCDALGALGQPETQIMLDAGGATINWGSIITLRSNFNNELLHCTPDGAAQVLPGGEDWRYWLLEKPESNKTFPEAPRETPLQVGDVVRLRAFTQRHLQMAVASAICHTGNPNAAIQRVSDRATVGGGPASSSGGPGIQEFVVERVGMGQSSNDRCIRRGAVITLKPVTSEMDNAPNYLRVNPSGSVTGTGSVRDKETGFIVQGASPGAMVQPLAGALTQGDTEIMVSPLWNKKDVKKHCALSAAWTKDEDLVNFKGHIVVAGANNSYTVPKSHGDAKMGWVAVVNEGVDVIKAAEQAKKQGATGIIVRCDGALSLDALSIGADGEHRPELPCVFVDATAGKALNERGLVLTGAEFSKKYMTDVMRALGKAASGESGVTSGEIFGAVGKALLARRLEVPKEVTVAPREVKEVNEAQEPAGQGKFLWKVTTNTAYMWNSTKMAVDYGKAAPPSATRRKVAFDSTGREVEHIDASADVAPDKSSFTKVLGDVGEVRTRTFTELVDAEDFKSVRLEQQLQDVLIEDGEMRMEDLPQLSEESDFKIEYHFEEVEVAVGGADLQGAEDDEIQIMQNEGVVVATLAVPPGQFVLVAIGLIITTVALCIVLIYTMQKQPESKKPDDIQDTDEDDPLPSARAALLGLRATALEMRRLGSAFLARR